MKVVILYNPNSTGESKQLATEFCDALAQADTTNILTIELTATQHAGHGEEIAASHAKKGEPCVIISASGDGGYHEVVNGALSADNSRVITGVLPAGNANDHHGAIGGDNESLIASILSEDYHDIDVLHLSAKVDGQAWARYAHSYAGIGVVARAARDLTKERPNVLQEKWLVAKSLFSFRYSKLIEGGKSRRYSSLVFSNIATMSKVLKLADESSLTDGAFEINRIRFHSKPRLLLYLATAATVGLKPAESVSRYTFTTTKATNIQLDGEVYTLDGGCDVTVTSQQKRLRYVR